MHSLKSFEFLDFLYFMCVESNCFFCSSESSEDDATSSSEEESSEKEVVITFSFSAIFL